jgi:hypothetical protein
MKSLQLAGYTLRLLGNRFLLWRVGGQPAVSRIEPAQPGETRRDITDSEEGLSGRIAAIL